MCRPPFGAEGPVGVAVASGAGTADSVISGDYDVDGFLDLFVTNGLNLQPRGFGGPNKLFHNNGNANHWVEVDLVGTTSDRDATGAKVYATAGGVTQLRVQNGAYHRWSQDAKRAHFGLAGNATVDLRVEWPSGNVQTFSVAANSLYRITENAGIAAVTLGVAPAYPCGPPTLNGAVDKGVFVWRDCATGQWSMRVMSANTEITYQGTITSTSNFTSFKPQGLEPSDSLNTSNPKQIGFTFNSKGTGSDGVDFKLPDGANACLQIAAPSGAQLFMGPFKTPISAPTNLETQVPPPCPADLGFALTNASVGEASGAVVLNVSRSGAAGGAVSVNFATSSGSATAESDFTSASGTLTWADGDAANKTITVDITSDTVDESDESFVVALSSPSGGALLGSNRNATVTIIDDDASGGGGDVRVDLDRSALTIGEGAGPVTFTVLRSGSASGAVSVSYATSSGSATAESDFTSASGTLTWADGDTAVKTITVNMTNDSTDESDETFTVTLSNPSSGAALGSNFQATVTIVDDDSPAPHRHRHRHRRPATPGEAHWDFFPCCCSVLLDLSACRARASNCIGFRLPMDLLRRGV